MKNKNTLYDVKITRFIISKRKNSSNFFQKNQAEIFRKIFKIGKLENPSLGKEKKIINF